MHEYEPPNADNPDIKMPTPDSDLEPYLDLDYDFYFTVNFEPPLTQDEEDELSVIFADPYPESVHENYDDLYVSEVDDGFEIDYDDGQLEAPLANTDRITVSELNRIAFRDGPVEDWGSPEDANLITERICNHLDCDLTAQIIAFAQQEAARQSAVFQAYSYHDILHSDYMNYRARMGRVATNLVKLFGQPNSENDEMDMVDAVLVALKPIDDQIQALSRRLPKF